MSIFFQKRERRVRGKGKGGDVPCEPASCSCPKFDTGSDHKRSHRRPKRVYSSENISQPHWSEHDTDDTSSGAEEERTSVWDVRRPHYSPYLLHRLQIGGETAVHCEYLLIDDSGNR